MRGCSERAALFITTGYEMNDIEKSKELFLKIYPNEKLCAKIMDYIKNHRSKLNFYIYFCKKGNWSLALKQKPFVKLCIAFSMLNYVKEKYDEKSIPEKVFFDTMSDIAIWIDDHKEKTGEDGLLELNWIKNHINMNIFKLGRLQFQMYRYYFEPVYKRGEKSIKYGERILNIHIPRGEPLDVGECRKSVETAKGFFKTYFSGYPTDFFICHSWLLYPGNKSFMKEGCNILRFAEMFDVVKSFDMPGEPYRWIFGVKINPQKLLRNKRKSGSYGFFDKLKCETSLQKSALEYVKNGGKLGDAMGVLLD